MARELNAVVSQRIEITPTLIKLRVVPDGWELPDFIPGQFGVLGLPATATRYSLALPEESPPNPSKDVLRAYSVASSSIAREYLEFYIGMVSTGSLSPRLFSLKAGDRLWLSPKLKGMFTLSRVPNDIDVVLIATGTGVAPYMSMIRTEVENGLRRRIAVIHGAYQSSDLGYHEELKTLASVSNIFSYFPIISHPQREKVEWKGEVGFVQRIWTEGILAKEWGSHPKAESAHVFLCGNPLMIDEMAEILQKEGFRKKSGNEPGQIHIEQYYVK
jgi:ferredoxin--NADP+ reductase